MVDRNIDNVDHHLVRNPTLRLTSRATHLSTTETYYAVWLSLLLGEHYSLRKSEHIKAQGSGHDKLLIIGF
jgi:hypothetical protein